jgi:hypothetical protein
MTKYKYQLYKYIIVVKYVDRRADGKRIAGHRDFGLVILVRKLGQRGKVWSRRGAGG